jgi:hypothetical protein
MMEVVVSLLDDFNAIDLEVIRGYLGKQEENLHLDFKLLPSPGFDNRQHRRTLAEVLSGFANSDGGICIWGVDARKNDEGLDVANTIEPIADVLAALGKLNEFTPSAVNPLVDGVQHKAIVTEGRAGVAVTLVPASDAGPHMAKQGEDRYFKRSGGSFVKMEHFDIEDMFGRRAKPQLGLSYEVRRAGGRTDAAGTHLQYLATISIRNSGRGAAIGPFLQLRPERPHKVHQWGLNGNGAHGLDPIVLSRFSEWEAFGGLRDNLAYPLVDLDVTAISLEYPPGSRIINVNVDYRLGAANHRLVEGKMTIRADDIMNAK